MLSTSGMRFTSSKASLSIVRSLRQTVSRLMSMRLRLQIDIVSLSAAEFVDLNNRIVDRPKFLHQSRAHERMIEFKVWAACPPQP
jgi:hypothetical protein